MNNLRLLAGLLFVVLLSELVCAADPTVLTLEEIFAIAEDNSTQLRPYFSAEDEARSGVAVARAGRLPDVNASLSVSYIGDGFTTRRNYSDYQRAPIPHLGTGLGVKVSQPLYSGGAITTAIDIAELKCTAARFSTELQRDNLRFQLAGFYLDIYKYGNIRSVLVSNIASARSVLAEMTRRYEQGMALRNDITRYELLLSNLELQLVRIDNIRNILNDNLVIIGGLPEGMVVAVDTMLLEQSMPIDGVAQWEGQALLTAPSLALARAGVELSRANERMVKAERMPHVGINAGWTIDGPILTEVPPINRNLSYWYVGVGVSYNISSLYKNNKALARGKAATAKAVDDLTAAREATLLAVRSDYVKYLEAYEELKSNTKSVELAERNYNVTANRYSEGMALITDMLDAADARLEAEQKLVNARINIIFYYYKLLFITGQI